MPQPRGDGVAGTELASRRTSAGGGQPSPRSGSGSTFAQQLQHSLRQLALVELHQSGFERVVEFRFAQRPGEPIQRVLVLELMGRHSNLLLLDEQRRIIALGRQVRDHQSRVRLSPPVIPTPTTDSAGVGTGSNGGL